LLAGFRNGVGGDTMLYMENFLSVPDQLNYLGDFIRDEVVESGYMPGWSIIVFFSKRWFDSFYAVQLIQAVIVNIGIFYLFRQYTSHIFLCALLYGVCNIFFMYNMEVMREGIAIVICGIGMHRYVQGRKWKFYVLVGIAVMFHISALIALLFPIVIFRQITIRTMIISFVAATTLFFLSDALVTYLPSLLGSGARNAEKIMTYSEKTLNLFGYLRNTFRYLVIEAGMIFFAQYSIDEKDEQKMNIYTRYMNFYLLVTILICGFIGFERFKNYTLIFYVIMLTEFIYNYKKQLTKNPVIKLIILLGIIVYMGRYYTNYYPDSKGYRYEFYYPYTSILDPEDIDTSHRKAMHEEANFKVDFSRK
jgi:hypothetical protein